MKPRHASALSLVGWYLMMPPSKTPKPDVLTLLAPIFIADTAAPVALDEGRYFPYAAEMRGSNELPI